MGPSGDGGSWTLTVGSAPLDDGRSLLLWMLYGRQLLVVVQPQHTRLTPATHQPTLLYIPIDVMQVHHAAFCCCSAAHTKKGRAHQQRELLLALSFVPLLLLACIVATSPPTGCSSNVSPGQKVGGGTPSLSPTARSIVYT